MATVLTGSALFGSDTGRDARSRRQLDDAAAPWAWRLHEWLLGRRTFTLTTQLRRSERWPRERLRELQRRKLRRLVRHARTHCPYYRDLRLPPASAIRDLDDIARLPLLTRDDLRHHARRMCWERMPARRLHEFSSGTFDESIRYFWDRRRQAWDKANRLRALAWSGQSVTDRDLFIWPYDPPLTTAARVRQWLRDHRDRALDQFQIDSLRAFGPRAAHSWRAWRSADPVRVTAYPSVLARLILDGRRIGCPMENPSLWRVFLTGEVTFDWQRALIEDTLGVSTVQDYGLQEVGALAFSCERGRWHTSAESALIEIVRDGRPARPGELGEIVATGLESLAMPVVRYCTGDIVRVAETACPCGRGLPVLPPVLGRAADFLEADDGQWIAPGDIVAALGAVLPDGSFQLEQAADGTVVARVARVPLAARPPVSCAESHWQQAASGTHAATGAPGATGGLSASVSRDVARAASCQQHPRAIVEQIRSLVGRDCRCSVQTVDRLCRSKFGKCRYVTSRRTAAGLAHRTD
ncbi:MAG: phenylacetate--CoA ligase family protein [Phycisphaerae bacterium]